MPTVLRIQGFRFFFYSNEGNEPLHVHVEKGDATAKVWLEPEINIAYSVGFSPSDERQLLKIVYENVVLIKQKWNEYFVQ